MTNANKPSDSQSTHRVTNSSQDPVSESPFLSPPSANIHKTSGAMLANQNAEFVARYDRAGNVNPSSIHNDINDTGLSRQSKIRLSISITLVCALILIAVSAAMTLVVDFTSGTYLMIGLCFFCTLIGGYIGQVYFSKHRKQHKEYMLLKEVLEGSRGARLITDGADNTIYTNALFEDLINQPSLDQQQMAISPFSSTKNGIEILADIFSSNPQAQSHFGQLAEKAYRGLTDSIELETTIQGNKKWFSVTAQPVSGWAGYVHWRLDDTTQKMQEYKLIHLEREKLIDFTDNAPVGFFSVNEDGRFLFANATLARWLGEDLSRLLEEGRLHQYLVTPPISSTPYDVIEHGGQKQITQIEMKGPAGKTWLASINQTVVKNNDGSIITRAVIHDLTSEQEMTQALKASEDRFHKFFEQAPLGIIIVSGQNNIEDCNISFAKLLGKKIPDIEGKKLNDVIHSDDQRNVLSTLDKIEPGTQISTPLEISLIHQETGELIVTQMYARRFRSNHQLVLHFIDLTQQKNLEAQFVQSQKMQAIGQLAGGVAHDFNNLLTAMTGFCDLLLLRHKPGDPSFGDIMQIKQNANRAANLVRQLLAFSRQQTMRPQRLDVTEILTEMSNLLRRLLGANIDLNLIHAADLDYIKADEGQMEQVLMNLAVNARDAMNGNGQLTIQTRQFTNEKTYELFTDDMPRGHWVAIDVIDTGTGIPDDVIKHILEPFFTTKDVGQGTGLGLSTVYGIIRQSGGYLDIQTQINKGTTFSIYLPVYEADIIDDTNQSADPSAPLNENESTSKNPISKAKSDSKSDLKAKTKKDEKPPRDLTGTARILLVEDEDAVRAFSSRALTNKGYEVISAEDAEDALELLEGEDLNTFDLLITDVIMPNMDGPELARQLRARRADLKIIFMSGYTEEKLKEEMDDKMSFLPKPFSLQKLAEMVKDVL